MDSHTPIHVDALEAARRIADRNGEFKLRDVVAALPHRNPATVRTHVASRCCVNAPAHHQSRWPYFRALGGGRYRVERTAPPVRRRRLPALRRRSWHDRVLAAFPSGIDQTLITVALRRTATQRLEYMRAAALSLDAMRPR